MSSSDSSTPMVSVVFRTMNSAGRIVEPLEAIRRQTYPNVEIIVVDNFSSDETCQIAASYGATVYQIGPERATQTNYGAEKAKGEFVMIVDDDMIADDDYVEKAVRTCLDGGYDAIYRAVRTRNDTFWGQVRALERKTYANDDLIESAGFFRRRVYLALGGYDTTIGPAFTDDYDMQARLNDAGYHTGRIDAVVHHTGEWQSLAEVAKRSFYYGQFAINYLRRQPTRGARQLFPVRVAYLRNWRLLLSDPVHLAGLIVFKSVQYIFGLSGMLASLVRGSAVTDAGTRQRIYGRSADQGEGDSNAMPE